MSIDKKSLRRDIPHHHADNLRRLQVGRGMAVTGDIAACDHLVVEGAVNASQLQIARLDIAEQGVFTGLAETQDATIAGRFEGRLIVHGRLTIKATAEIAGEIHYGSIEAEAGCRLDVQMAHIAPTAQEEPAGDNAPANNIETLARPPQAASAGDTDIRTGIFRRVVGY